jgi:hypothetical protein
MNSLLFLAAVPANRGGWLGINGPSFLVLYFIWFLLTRLTVALLRARGHDTFQTTLAGLVAFEGLGLARIYDGSRHGMHNWDFLIVGMVVGGFLFLVRPTAGNSGGLGGNDSSSSWSSCSSSSSSSGGGGCGGGSSCGGCGGGGD